MATRYCHRLPRPHRGLPPLRKETLGYSRRNQWDYDRHYFWNVTTYGYVGDVDGDGASEFMFMSADWHTVHVHDGKTGNRKVSVPLPDSTAWMYTFLARRAEDYRTPGHPPCRVLRGVCQPV